MSNFENAGAGSFQLTYKTSADIMVAAEDV
jgi:hypothetical protein